MARDVAIVGVGQTKVGEHWNRSLRHLAADAVLEAIQDAAIERVDALYVGNMISGATSAQEHLGALITDFVGLRGAESFKVEAACASGSAAFRVGYMAVASGLMDFVVVVGVEKMTDAPVDEVTRALATAADADYESAYGLSFVSLNALLMRRYLYEFDLTHDAFAGFTVNAHANSRGNPKAMFRFPISKEQFLGARMIADPINLLDSSPIADGAAALILCPAEMANQIPAKPVRVRSSAVATDSVALHDRRDPLFLEAVALSSQRAYDLAGIGPDDLDFYELHDAFTVMAALSLEAAGFAPRGQGTRLAEEGEIPLDGRIPIATMGGLKGRGHPVGATGMYQLAEATLQLRGEAGENQIPDARLGMTQNIGGSGGTVVTHVLEAWD